MYWLTNIVPMTALSTVYCRHYFNKKGNITAACVEFKQALFVYKVLRQTAPPYLADMCQPVSTSSTRRHLRSADHGNFVEPRCRTTRYGKRSFPASAPLTWNSPPMTICDSFYFSDSFSGRLKAELFRRANGTDLVPVWQLSVNSLCE